MEPEPIACKEPKGFQSSLRIPPRKSAYGIWPGLLFLLSEGLLVGVSFLHSTDTLSGLMSKEAEKGCRLQLAVLP